ENPDLLPAAQQYRKLLDELTEGDSWEVSAAVTTLFLEGTAYERGELDPTAPRRPVTPLSEHPLVKHYGLPLADLELTRAHRKIEGEHRGAAWRVLLDHIPDAARAHVISQLERVLSGWLTYRDDVALA